MIKVAGIGSAAKMIRVEANFDPLPKTLRNCPFLHSPCIRLVYTSIAIYTGTKYKVRTTLRVVVMLDNHFGANCMHDVRVDVLAKPPRV